MDGSKFNNCNGEVFFGAVTKSCAVIVGRSKRTVREQLAKRGVAKPNVAMFKCQQSGNDALKKKLLNRPRFKLTSHHHLVLTKAGLSFILQNEAS